MTLITIILAVALFLQGYTLPAKPVEQPVEQPGCSNVCEVIFQPPDAPD